MRSAFVPLLAALMAIIPVRTARAQSDEGLRFRLRQDTVISGVHCAPTGRVYAVVHPNGSLDECPLALDTVIDGIPCRGASFLTDVRGSTQVTLYPSGKLKTCRLNRAITRDGRSFRGSERIILSEDGHAQAAKAKGA